jgi:hypothetical protein
MIAKNDQELGTRKRVFEKRREFKTEENFPTAKEEQNVRE